MPKYEYKALKDIDKKIERVLDRHNLNTPNTVAESIKANQKFFFATPVYRGEKVMFKARIADHRVLKKSGKLFSVERRFLRTLKKYDPVNPIVQHLPVYIKSQKSSCEWLMCKFIERQTIGATDQRYDNPTKEEILEILTLLTDIQAFDINGFMETHNWVKEIRVNKAENYLNSFDKCVLKNQKNISHFFIKSDLTKAREIIDENKVLIDDNCNLLVHGDFHPANIFIHDNLAIAIDWESMRIGNSATDVTTLWQRMTSHPDLRKYLLEEYAKQSPQMENFRQLFRIDILVSLLWEIQGLHSHMQLLSNKVEKKEIKNRLDLCYNNYMTALNNGKIEQYD